MILTEKEIEDACISQELKEIILNNDRVLYFFYKVMGYIERDNFSETELFGTVEGLFENGYLYSLGKLGYAELTNTIGEASFNREQVSDDYLKSNLVSLKKCADCITIFRDTDPSYGKYTNIQLWGESFDTTDTDCHYINIVEEQDMLDFINSTKFNEFFSDTKKIFFDECLIESSPDRSIKYIYSDFCHNSVEHMIEIFKGIYPQELTSPSPRFNF